MLKRTE